MSPRLHVSRTHFASRHSRKAARSGPRAGPYTTRNGARAHAPGPASSIAVGHLHRDGIAVERGRGRRICGRRSVESGWLASEEAASGVPSDEEALPSGGSREVVRQARQSCCSPRGARAGGGGRGERLGALRSAEWAARLGDARMSRAREVFRRLLAWFAAFAKRCACPISVGADRVRAESSTGGRARTLNA
jgi:hypothetical protein